VCIGIALAGSEMPTELTGRPDLVRRLHLRGERPEYRFLIDDRRPRLPVIRDGQLVFPRWGNTRGQSRHLPRAGWTWVETVESGGWRGVETRDVVVPATLALEGGVCYKVRVGMRALLVPDERGKAVAYLVCEPASHYYRIMTRSDRMPVLIGERI
jgi:hypothetical protein